MYGLTKLTWAKYELEQFSKVLEADMRESKRKRVEQHMIDEHKREKREAERYKQRELQKIEQATRQRESRRQSKTGKKLQSECLQWKIQQDTMQTRTVEEMAKKSCDRYQKYIDTGHI